MDVELEELPSLSQPLQPQTLKSIQHQPLQTPQPHRHRTSSGCRSDPETVLTKHIETMTEAVFAEEVDANIYIEEVDKHYHRDLKPDEVARLFNDGRLKYNIRQGTIIVPYIPQQN